MKTLKKITAAMMLCLALAGCGVTPEETPKEPQQTPETASEAAQLLEAATYTGSVTALTAEGFRLSPDQAADGGQSAVQAAPGHENAATEVAVVYQPDCVFQLATIDAASGAMTCTEAVAADIKKNTAVAIYGETQTDGTVLAQKVVITRYQGATGVGGA